MNVLIVKLSSMGDLFHALPTVHNIAVGMGATIDWVTTVSYVDLVQCFTDVNRVIPFYRHALLQTAAPFLKELRAEKYDLIIDLQGLMKSAIVTRLARGKRRIGPSFNREGTRLLYSEVAGTRNKNRHAIEENRDLIGHLGLDLVPVEFPIRFPPAGISDAHPRVAIAPSSRWVSKNWPLERFTETARRLRESEGATIHLVGGPEDSAACSAIEESLGGEGVQNWAGRLSLVESGGLLADMDLLICNDSGPMHMAAAVGTPTLALFGPTNPLRTGPYGDGHRVLQARASCVPCYANTCSAGQTTCLEDITADDVQGAATEMIHQTSR